MAEPGQWLGKANCVNRILYQKFENIIGGHGEANWISGTTDAIMIRQLQTLNIPSGIVSYPAFLYIKWILFCTML